MESDSQTETEIDAETEAQLDAEAETDANAEAESDAEAELDAEAVADSDAESLADAEASDEVLLEVSKAPVAAGGKRRLRKKVPKVHVHVATKLHGGANSENLLRVEERLDALHDRVMGRLNRLMSRITRHPDTIEDKTAAYDFKA